MVTLRNRDVRSTAAYDEFADLHCFFRFGLLMSGCSASENVFNREVVSLPTVAH